MEVLIPNCAGMDVHQESIVVCALNTDAEGNVLSEVQTFGTLTKNLFELLSWLESKSITHVAMESTGIYWKPVYNILEGYFDVTLANAQRIKNVPGRKTDVCDAEWIAKLLRVGLIEPSFILPEDLRELRDLCRLRKKRVGNLTAEKNRIQKYLESCNVKLGTIISDVFGVSGRNLLDRLVKQGYVDARDVEECVKGSIKNKKQQVAVSLFGTITPHQVEVRVFRSRSLARSARSTRKARRRPGGRISRTRTGLRACRGGWTHADRCDNHKQSVPQRFEVEGCAAAAGVLLPQLAPLRDRRRIFDRGEVRGRPQCRQAVCGSIRAGHS